MIVDIVSVASRLAFPLKWIWERLFDRPSAPALYLMIISKFPVIFATFNRKWFSLLQRGGRNFHDHYDGHATTLTVIEDTKGNIFAGFVPVKWELPIKSEGRNRSYPFRVKSLKGLSILSSRVDDISMCLQRWR
jgi:hypothetical protein